MSTPSNACISQNKYGEYKKASEEYDKYSSFAGSIISAGHGTLPEAAFIRLFMQHVAQRLRVKHLTKASRMIREVKELNPEIRFKKLKKDIKRTEL